jgi:two-component system, sensor histidine kinase
LRRALGLLLEKWGMTVLEAASGEEALALIEEIGILPDIFIVDHQLGDGMTGIELLSRLRAAHGLVPARLITADRGGELQEMAALAGIEILYKPIDPRALEAVVARL